MAVGQYGGVVVIILVMTLTNIQCSGDVNGPFFVECLDNNLLITVILASQAVEPHLEAINAQGRFPIPEGGDPQCGYTYKVYERLGLAVFRASYFSCYTKNKNDTSFTFNFQLSLLNHDDAVHRITKTCSPPGLSHREIACAENYIEVSVQTDLPWHMRSLKDEEMAAAVPKVQESASSVWQIMFLRRGKLPAVLSVAEAAEQGYFLDVTSSRIVFRTAHGQDYSVSGLVSGLEIEDIRPVVFLRQGFRTMIVDLSASCTLDDPSYEDDALIWKTLTEVSPMVSAHTGFRNKHFSFGVEGRPLDPEVAAERGLRFDVGPEIVEVSVPYGAKGGLRKTFVMDNKYHEFYAISLFYEHIFTTDEDTLESRLHYVREMTTPVMIHTPFTTNLTVLEDRVFTVYVGDFPFDVELVSLSLNGMKMSVQEAVQNGYQLSKTLNDQSTHGYTIYVPFEDPVVSKMYYVEGVLEYSLTLKYTLHIMPQEEEYFYLTTVVAHIRDVYPPYINGQCMENGIKFRLNHQQFDYLFELGIGPYPLTQELADARGYIMSNNSQSLTLEVPLFSVGYVYEDVSLEAFRATFDIVIRDAKTLKTVQSVAKICQFPTTEMLVCSPNGTVTIVADLTKAIPSALPSTTTLLDKACTPTEVDQRRVLFEFPLNTCGTRFQVANGFLTYENEIVFEKTFSPEEKPVITRDSEYRVILRCMYPVHGINRLIIDRGFQSQTPGIGTIQIQKPMERPVTVAPRLTTTTARKVATTRRVTTTTPAPTTRRVRTTTPATTVSSVAKPTNKPVKYVLVKGGPLGLRRRPSMPS